MAAHAGGRADPLEEFQAINYLECVRRRWFFSIGSAPRLADVSPETASAFPPDARATSASEAPNLRLGAYFLVSIQMVVLPSVSFWQRYTNFSVSGRVLPDIRHGCLICSR
jgi:hypothetical protein